MKINVCLSDQDVIDGYQNISISQIDSIVNGSVDEILFTKLDNVPHNERLSIVSSILNKMKYNGTLTIELLDLISIGKDISSGALSSKTVSSLVQNIVSVGYEFDILEHVGNFPQYQVQKKYSHNYKLKIHIVKK